MEAELKELERLATRSEQLASGIGAAAAEEAFRALREKISNPQLHICFVGRTSAGKTTLVNTLVGRSAFPATADPTTALVAEVRNSATGIQRLLAVGKQGEASEVSVEKFHELCRTPGDCRRLILEEPTLRYGLRARIFDTPGYDSVYEQHGEVLRSFIPQADLLVFVVLHRSGLSTADSDFLKMLQEVFGDTLPPLALVVNRVPPGTTPDERRVAEIVNGVQRLTNATPKLFLVGPIDTEVSQVESAEMTAVWEYLRRMSEDPARKRALAESAIAVMESALASLQDVVDYRASLEKADRESMERLHAAVRDLRKAEQEIFRLIEQRGPEIIRAALQTLAKEKAGVHGACHKAIDQANRWTKAQECQSFLINHVLPREAELAAKHIGQAVFQELEHLDKQIEDMANTAIGHFHRSINLTFDKFEKLKESLAKKAAEEGFRRTAFAFLSRFGGRGGAGAGMANFAKMALKRIGGLFGKNFSRETHNALAQFLKRIGATSTKVLSAVVAVLIEVVFYLYHVATWQGKLKQHVDESIDSWADKLAPQLAEEIEANLRETRLLVAEAFDLQASDLQSALREAAKPNAAGQDSVSDWQHELMQLWNEVTRIRGKIM